MNKCYMAPICTKEATKILQTRWKTVDICDFHHEIELDSKKIYESNLNFCKNNCPLNSHIEKCMGAYFKNRIKERK